MPTSMNCFPPLHRILRDPADGDSDYTDIFGIVKDEIDPRAWAETETVGG